jgi:hypothetical protein
MVTPGFRESSSTRFPAGANMVTIELAIAASLACMAQAAFELTFRGDLSCGRAHDQEQLVDQLLG